VAAEPFREQSSSNKLSVFFPKTLRLPAPSRKGIRWTGTSDRQENLKRQCTIGFYSKHDIHYLPCFQWVQCSAYFGRTESCASLKEKLCPLPERRLVGVLQHFFQVAFPIQDFTAQLDIGYPSLIAVVLECPSAQFQLVRHLLVGQVAFTAQQGTVIFDHVLHVVEHTVKVVHKAEQPLASLGHQVIVHRLFLFLSVDILFFLLSVDLVELFQ